MKRRVSWALMALLVVAGTTLAQEASQPGAPQDQQPGAPGQRRVRPGGMGGGMSRDFMRYLNLTPEQQTKVQEIQQQAREEQRQQRQQAGGNQRSPQDRQKMQEMHAQLNEAAKAGDDAKVEQLQAEMRSSGMGAQFQQQQAKMFDQIEQILTPEQRVTFKQWRTVNEAGLPSSLVSDPEALQKAVLKIDTLSDLQKNQIEALFVRFKREAGSPSATPESKQALQLKLACDVVKELKPSQKVLLSAANRQGPPGGGPGRQPRDTGPGSAPAGNSNG